MRPSRSHSWRTAWQPVVLGAVLAGGLSLGRASALDTLDEPLAVAEEQSVPQTEAVGESVGEPAVEDAPVEGEPGPGDAVSVPPEEEDVGGQQGDASQSPAEDSGTDAKPDD